MIERCSRNIQHEYIHTVHCPDPMICMCVAVNIPEEIVRLAVHVLAAMSAKECAGPVMEELMSNEHKGVGRLPERRQRSQGVE